jgi:hypothetical protein
MGTGHGPKDRYSCAIIEVILVLTVVKLMRSGLLLLRHGYYFSAGLATSVLSDFYVTQPGSHAQPAGGSMSDIPYHFYATLVTSSASLLHTYVRPYLTRSRLMQIGTNWIHRV